MKKILLVLMLVMLSSVVSAERMLVVSVDSYEAPTGFTGITVLDSQGIMDERLFEDQREEISEFKLVTLDSEGVELSRIALAGYNTATIFDKHTSKILLIKGNRTISEVKISFCNNNSVCEPCSESGCETAENYLVCSDCSTGEEDTICDGASDGVCDKDCEFSELDSDCDNLSEPTILDDDYEYSDAAELFPEDLEQEDAQADSLTTDSMDDNYFEEDGSYGLTLYDNSDDKFIYIVATVLIVVLFAIAVFASKKAKSSVKVQYLDPCVKSLISKGYNYVQVKQALLNQGYNLQYVDEAIRKDYSERAEAQKKQNPQQPKILMWIVITIVVMLTAGVLIFSTPVLIGHQIAESSEIVHFPSDKSMIAVDPSFHVSVPYDFEIYKTIRTSLEQLESCDDNLTCIVENITKLESKSLNWMVEYNGQILTKNATGADEKKEWIKNCESKETLATNTFVETLQSCANSVTDDCICETPVPNVTSDPWWAPDTSDWENINLEVKSKGQNDFFTVISLENAKLQSLKNLRVDNTKLFIDDGSIRPAEDYTFKYDSFDDVSKMVFYRENQNRIILSEPEQMEKYEDKKVCDVNDKTLKFCIVNDKNMFLTFDSAKNKPVDEPIVVKFAYPFEKKLTDVPNVMIDDLKLSEDKVIVSWDETDPTNTLYYQVYYGTENFEGRSVSDLLEGEFSENLGSEINFTEPLMKEDAILFYSFNISQVPECIFEADSRACTPMYEAFKHQTVEDKEAGFLPEEFTLTLEQGKLYYSEKDRIYFIVLSNISSMKSEYDTEKVFYGVLASDLDGVISEGFEAPIIKVPETEFAVTGGTGKSIDDLPPGIVNFSVINTTVSIDGVEETGASFRIENLTRNIDGSEMTDLAFYRIYCAGDGDEMIDLEEEPVALGVIASQHNNQVIKFNVSGVDISLYCGSDLNQQKFAIIAEDEVPNIYSLKVPTVGYNNI